MVVEDPRSCAFWYRFEFARAVDGDTIDGYIDLGFKMKWKQRLRLYDVDTPELRSSDPMERDRARQAKDLVGMKLEGATEVWINTIKNSQGKYGRYLAIIHYYDGEEWRSLNDELIEAGLAERYMVD